MCIKVYFSKLYRGLLLFIVLILLDTFIEFNKSKPVSAVPKDSITLPIVMYHSFLKDSKLQNDYCISPTVLENDLKYITSKGYTTVTPKDLVKYVNGKPLPKKIIMITFDDGFYNNYHYAYPLLKKYNCKAVISPIVSLAEEYSEIDEISATYGYCSFDNLLEMEKSGLVEIANHSYDMHYTKGRFGVRQKQGENLQTYENNLKNDINKAQKLLKDNSIKKPLCFTYPYGAESESTLEIIKSMNFKCTLTCEEKTNYIYPNKTCLYELGRYNRTSKENSNTFFERICN